MQKSYQHPEFPDILMMKQLWSKDKRDKKEKVEVKRSYKNKSIGRRMCTWYSYDVDLKTNVFLKATIVACFAFSAISAENE
mgnify:CR=1 FL=1